eukprot:GHRQ01022157.1.p1 GENE.GHRQ01022157.1~~GHRQ01022157.1.p1  ORF type:complete len:132 (-),score=6.95 GHRQ01022157.1:1589-1984(-)
MVNTFILLAAKPPALPGMQSTKEASCLTLSLVGVSGPRSGLFTQHDNKGNRALFRLPEAPCAAWPMPQGTVSKFYQEDSKQCTQPPPHAKQHSTDAHKCRLLQPTAANSTYTGALTRQWPDPEQLWKPNGA